MGGQDERVNEDAAGHPTPAISPAWAERLEQCRRNRPPAAEAVRVVPLSADYFEGRLTLVEGADDARRLVELARQRPLAYAGLDFEYRFSRPGVWIKKFEGKDLYWYDPHSYVPLLLAVCLVEDAGGGTVRLYRFAVDCRSPETVAPLGELFRLPMAFAGHNLKAELICLWRLGLPVPDRLWDTWAAEKALLLGLYHPRYKKERPADELEEAQAKEEAEAEAELKLDLPATCDRRDVPYRFAADKQRLQQSFLTHPDEAPFTAEQLDYNAADAEAAVRLLPAQTQAALSRGCLAHLLEVEMPWVQTNARMVYDGVRVDPEKCGALLAACKRHRERIGAELRDMGLGNVNSHPQMVEFFRGLGLLDLFRVRGGYSFADERLEEVENRHPAMARVRLLRKISRLLTDKAFTGELAGADGRLHPDHRQLGAETGRNAMRWPNIGGVGRALRPVVVPQEGYGVGEVDLAQIEVGIAAAFYNDPDLIAMFNGRDVYTQMAKSFFATELSPEALGLRDKEFKKRYGAMRDRMKVCTLATIYNITPHGLSAQLGITVGQAARELEKFLGLFPALARAQREEAAFGAIRGYANVCSGLRRWRARRGAPTAWETNWLINTPVQGSAGVVFKLAGNRLYRRYQHYGARLILPMHDAFVFEAPRAKLGQVAKITGEVMRSTVQERFPALDPQVEINIDHPDCWNKDGKWQSLELWMIDPELAR